MNTIRYSKLKLTENEQELLFYFNKLSEREQIKWITRIEDAAAEYKKSEKESNQGKARIINFHK